MPLEKRTLIGVVIAVAACITACSGKKEPADKSPLPSEIVATPEDAPEQVDHALPVINHRADLSAVTASSPFEAAVVVWRVGEKTAHCIGKQTMCTESVAPASTFKIPHALIALELGVASGPAHPMKWDGVRRGIKSWNRDQTLSSAIRVSAVWYFQRLAALIGRSRMAAWLEKLEYGNHSIGSDVRAFWLDGTLRVSPLGQLRFWHRLVSGEHPVKPAVSSTLIDMTLLGQSEGRRLIGKTGWFRRQGETDVGWLVGCLLETSGTACFASQIRATDPFDKGKFLDERHDLTARALAAMGHKPISTR